MTELLDLSTVVERDTIRLRSKRHPDGKLYELVNIDELGPFEHETIVARHQTVSKLVGLARKPTPPEKRQLSKALRDILKLLLLDLEPSVLAEIDDSQGAKIVTVWAVKNSGAAVGEAPAGPTTAGSSRASRRSTAATPKRGSTSRRGR